MICGWVRRENQRTVRRSRTRVQWVQEEAYLRHDIPCGSDLCAVCSATAPSLAAGASHYLIPDATALRDLMDLLESPDLQSIILLASVVRAALRSMHLRKAARLRAMYRDRRRRCILFDDLHHVELAARGTPDDLMAAADWYHRHLGGRLPVVVLSDDLDRQFGGGQGGDDELQHLLRQLEVCSAPPALQGVRVMSAERYFHSVWGNVPAVVDVYDSLVASQQEQRGQQQQQHHLSPAALQAGLARGTLLQGVLHVGRNDNSRAAVLMSGRGPPVAITSRDAMQRAMHGDTVVVRVWPKQEWVPLQDALAADEAGGATDFDSGVMAGAADEAAEAAVTGAQGDEESVSMAYLTMSRQSGGTDPQQQLQPTGEVVGVVQRSVSEVVACISEQDERALAQRPPAAGRQEAVLCVPTDRRLPRMRLRSRQLERLLGQRLVLRVDGWEAGSNYPHVHVVRVLGPVGTLRAETDAILARSGIRWEPFSQASLRELPAVDEASQPAADPGPQQDPADPGEGYCPCLRWSLTQREVAQELAAGRRDLRGQDYFVVSIDPPGCTDVDDALHVRQLGGGVVEVGVHIADVSHFVREGSALDAEAAARCTTVYLVGRRLSMLPPILSEDAASLVAGRDRLAVSVIWTLRMGTGAHSQPASGAPGLKILDVWFGRTLIRSRYQLEYQQAQDMLDRRESLNAVLPPDRQQLLAALQVLAAAGDTLRAARIAAGAVELESAELRFRTGDGGRPTQVQVKAELPVMKTVAEWMILANATVGRRLYEAAPRSALLRRHPPPLQEALAEVAELCKAAGVYLDPSRLGESLNAAVASPAVASLLRSKAARAMSEAEYWCAGDADARGAAGLGHYGLALEFYTHFTSPIRRYADIVAHRQLLAAVCGGGEALPPPAEVSQRAGVMNDRHRAAKKAQRDCADLFLLLLLHATPHAERALITDVLPGPVLRLFVPKYHAKGLVHLTDQQGLPRRPLLTPDDKDDRDPHVLAARRRLQALEGTDAAGRAVASLVDTASGDFVASFAPLQPVWVEMGADSSKTHGPVLRLTLLAEGHPAVQKALQQEAAQPSTSSAGGGRAQSRKAASRADHPPGVAPATNRSAAPGAVDREAAIAKPPPCSTEEPATPAAPGPAAVEEALSLPPVPPRLVVHAAAAATPPDAPVHRLLEAARQLQAKTGRYALRAAAADPRATTSAHWAARAAACQQEAGRLQQQLSAMMGAPMA